jgi:hypothetical protein
VASLDIPETGNCLEVEDRLVVLVVHVGSLLPASGPLGHYHYRFVPAHIDQGGATLFLSSDIR